MELEPSEDTPAKNTRLQLDALAKQHAMHEALQKAKPALLEALPNLGLLVESQGEGWHEMTEAEVQADKEMAAKGGKSSKGPVCPDSAVLAMFEHVNEKGKKFVGVEGSRNAQEKKEAWTTLAKVVTAAAERAGVEHTWSMEKTKELFNNKQRKYKYWWDKAEQHKSGAENFWARNKKPVWYDAANLYFSARAAVAPTTVVEVGSGAVKVTGAKRKLASQLEKEDEEEVYDEDPGGRNWSTHVMRGTGTGGGVPQSLPTSPEPAPREEHRKSKAAARAEKAAAADAGVAAKKAAAGAAAAAADEIIHQRNATFAAKANADAISAVLAPLVTSFASILEKGLAALAAPPPPPPPPPQ